MDIETVYGRTNEVIPNYAVSSFTMLQIPQYARAMNFLSGNLASFPIDVYQNEMQIKESHPLDPIFSRRANPSQNSFSFFRQWYLDGEHRGNGYAYIRRPAPTSPDVIGLYNLPPETIMPYRVIPDGSPIWDAMLYYWHSPSKQPIAAADILHYTPGLAYDGLVGYAPYQLFGGTFARANALQVFQTKYLLKGTLIKASIEVPAGATKEQKDEIVNAMRQYRADTADKDTILLVGGATLKTQTANAQQSQLIEQDAAITRKISMLTDVAPQFLFDSADQKYNAASTEAEGQNLVRFTFRTRLENIENELTTKLLSEDEQDAGYSIRLDTSSLIRGDTAVQMTVATTGANQGIITPNEGREQIGLLPLPAPENDKLRVPTHLVANPAATESESHSAVTPTDHYAAFQPLLDHAAAKVEAKAANALETASKKPEKERTAYCNALAESQASYAAKELGPVAQTIEAVTGRKMDIGKITEAYSAEIRRRATGQEPKGLTAIMGDINGTV